MAGITRNPDVFVAGGGPAGLAAAIALAGRGFTVEVADARRPPIDKTCGEGLMPDAVDSLAALGVPLAAVDGVRLAGIRFLGSAGTVEAAFPGRCGIGLRRIHLHRLLWDRAERLGVRLRWGTVVQQIADGRVQTSAGPVCARWVVGADGPQSRVRRLAGLEAGRRSAARIGIQQHFRVEPWTDHVEVHWSREGQAYVTPVGESEVGIVFLTKRKPDLESALSAYPALRRHIGEAQRIGLPRGAFTRNCMLERVTSGEVALVGDASGSVDAVTGEGLALCFRQAVALADALEMGEMKAYRKAHRELQRLPMWMSRAMLLLDRSSWLQTNAFGAFARRPELFQRVLEVHIGHRTATAMPEIAGMLRTGAHILAHRLVNRSLVQEHAGGACIGEP